MENIDFLVNGIKAGMMMFHVLIIYFAVTTCLNGYYNLSTLSQFIDLMLLLSAKTSLTRYSINRIQTISQSTYEKELILLVWEIYKGYQRFIH